MIATIEIHCNTEDKNGNQWTMFIKGKKSIIILKILAAEALDIMRQENLEPMFNNSPTLIKYA